MELVTLLLSVISIAAVCLSLVLLFQIRMLLRANRELRDTVEFAENWAIVNEAEAKVLVLAVTPLLEQTDWMTGRWGGKLDQLVRLENSRNANVRNARRAFNEIPLVQRATMEMFTPGSAFREALAKKANYDVTRLKAYDGHDTPQDRNPHDPVIGGIEL
jgi:hypothetical protein